MKIMMLLIGHDFPPDIRVEKEARALLAAGHQLTLVCENRKNRPSRENYNGIDIIRLPRLPLWLRRINTALLFMTTRSPVWEQRVKKLAQDLRPDALHVHDLPFIGPGLRIAQKLGLPLVADLHENFPALLQIRREGLQGNLFDRAIFSPRRFADYERRVVPACDYVIVVVKEAATRVKELGVEDEKVFIVGNTEDVDAIGPLRGADLDLPPSDMRLLYVGGFGPHRGLKVVIQAMPKILEQIPSAVFIIVGDGAKQHTAELKQLVEQLRVTSAVRFEGWQPFDKVHSYIQACDVCLVPHRANPHTNATMPHKLFQYMYMQKPVIVSSAAPLARVIQETNAGLVFESGDPTAFSRCVFQLQDRAIRHELGARGQQAVVQYYNWRHDAQRLVELYQTLANERYGEKL